MDILIALIIVVSIIAVSVGLSFGIGGIINLCFNITEKKRKKAHPQLWVWFDECDDAILEECRWHNSMIKPLKDKVDAILREWDYYTAETKLHKEEELENLRKVIESANKVYIEMHNKTETIRSKIHGYVEEHDLEWARHWGW